MSLAEKLRQAIHAHVDDVRDVEGASPIDVLAMEIKSSADGAWREALKNVVQSTLETSGNWWDAVQFLVASANLCSRDLADALESRLAAEPRPDAVARASIYALLAECGRPLPAMTIGNDNELKITRPLLWLDLVLPLVETPRKQSLIREAVRNRQFRPADFAARLDYMRDVGGRDPGAWLDQLRAEFAPNDRPKFDEVLVRAGFKLPASHASSKAESTVQALKSAPKIDVKGYLEQVRNTPVTYPQYTDTHV